VLMNAGAAIYVGGAADDIEAGVKRARDVIASGDAASKLEELVSLSKELG